LPPPTATVAATNCHGWLREIRREGNRDERIRMREEGIRMREER